MTRSSYEQGYANAMSRSNNKVKEKYKKKEREKENETSINGTCFSLASAIRPVEEEGFASQTESTVDLGPSPYR
jgi:hypothetical protein